MGFPAGVATLLSLRRSVAVFSSILYLNLGIKLSKVVPLFRSRGSADRELSCFLYEFAYFLDVGS